MSKPLECWHVRESNTPEDLNAVAFDPNISKFLAAGNVLCTSKSGVSWSAHDARAGVFVALSCANGLVTGVRTTGGELPFTAITTSADGVAWTDGWQLPSDIADGCHFNHIAFGNGAWVVGGELRDLASGMVLFYSGDNTATWREIRIPFTDIVLGPVPVAFGGGHFIAISDQNLATSSDGLNWNAKQISYLGVVVGVAVANGLTVVATKTDILTSPDQWTWTSRFTDHAGRIRRVASCGKAWVVTGDDGLLVISDDGINWTGVDTNTHNSLTGFSSDGITGLIVGERGLILQSDPLDSRYLTVYFRGQGRGIVFTTPAGVLAEQTASAPFSPGTEVLVSARTQPDMTVHLPIGGVGVLRTAFDGWSGDVISRLSDCSLVMTRDRHLTASFSQSTSVKPPKPFRAEEEQAKPAAHK